VSHRHQQQQPITMRAIFKNTA